MRKQMIFRLSVLAVFLALLWSCRSEDFTKAETNPQRNNADFFKHKSSLSAKNTTDYIRILEEYSQETDFLSGMPDQKGMPIWDKMKVVETKEATGLTIPLSYDNETMSSILFATLDGRNTVTGVKDYDNALLESIVYDQKIGKENRERLFLTFMHMDNRTFGNEQFIGIPKDLFIGKKSDDEYGVLWVRDFAPSSSVTIQGAGKLMIIETCFLALHCTHHGQGICDAEQGCTECGTTFCTYEVIGTADDPFPSTGGGSTGGCFSCGGGSGGNGPGPNVPLNPCGIGNISPVFYRPAPGCDGGGTLPGIDDPCQKAFKGNTKAKELLNKAKIVAAKSQITSTLSTDTNEKSFSYGKDSSGNYDTTPIKTATAGNQVGLQANNPNLSIEGGAHTHTPDLYNCFSAGDIYSLQGANVINPKFTNFFVFADGGISYALTIIDPVKYANFVANHSAGSNLDMSTSNWQTTSPIYVSFESAMKQFIGQGYSKDDALANAIALVLSKYDVGATLSQSDSSGNFNSIFVEENVHNINVSGITVSVITYKRTPDCNLK